MFGLFKKKNGIDKDYYPNGNLQTELTYVNGVRHGPFKAYHENGKLAVEGEFYQDRHYGLITTYYESGVKNAQIEYDYLHRQVGDSIAWHENGNIKGKSKMVDGLAQGLCEHFHENGQLSIRFKAVDGEIDGLFEEFDENGTLISSTEYSMGNIIG